MKVRVLIATTEGPATILKIAEDDPEVPSVICIDRTTNVLPISPDYRRFVQKGTGVIARLTNHNSYRIDVDRRIDSGFSWQLPILLAHLLQQQKKLAARGETADVLLFATGEVKQDLSVSPVDHIEQKIAQISQFLASNKENGHCEILVFVPAGQIPEHIELPGYTQIMEVGSVREIERYEVLATILPQEEEPKAQLPKIQESPKSTSIFAKISFITISVLLIGLLSGYWMWQSGPGYWQSLSKDGEYSALATSLDEAKLPFLSSWFQNQLKDLAPQLESATISVSEVRTANGQNCRKRRFQNTELRQNQLKVDTNSYLKSVDMETLCELIYRAENKGSRLAYVYFIAFSAPASDGMSSIAEWQALALPVGGQAELKLDTSRILARSVTLVAIAIPTASKSLRAMLEGMVQSHKVVIPDFLFPQNAKNLGMTVKILQHALIL
jgi:hypothetical protein